MRIASCVSGLLVASFAAELALALPIAPPAAGNAQPQNAPTVVQSRDTPSGARSPSRSKRQRKGTVARSAPRATKPAAAPGGAAGGAGGTNVPVATPNAPAATPAAAPDPAALEHSLALPENAEFRLWYEAPHDFTFPRPQMARTPFDQWADDDACVAKREGDTKFMAPGCKPRELSARLWVDRAAGVAIEQHFGLPSQLLSSIGCYTEDGGCVAVEAAVRSTLADHGIICTEDAIMPDHQWILDRSVAVVAPVAQGVLEASFGNEQITQRQQVEALAEYVQAAIPYRTIKGPKDDLVQDGNQRCGLRTPVATLMAGGDCDSKSLLLASLLRAVDPRIPVALVHCMSGDTPHMILAVGCDAAAGDQTIVVNRMPMVLIETTSDWGVGFVSTKIDLQDAEAQPLK